MKTSELIAVLQQRLEKHGDIEVVCLWDSIRWPFEKGAAQVYLGYAKSGETLQLIIDADRNTYKKDEAQDPSEGEP